MKNEEGNIIMYIVNHEELVEEDFKVKGKNGFCFDHEMVNVDNLLNDRFF